MSYLGSVCSVSQRALVVHLSYFDNSKPQNDDRNQGLVHRIRKILTTSDKYAKITKTRITLKGYQVACWGASVHLHGCA